MRLLILTGKTEAYKGEVYETVLPGLDGEFAVLGFHQPLLYRLRKGVIKIRKTGLSTSEELFPIKDGLAKFSGNTLLVLTEKLKKDT